MEISNTEEEYGLIAKAFHWVIAVLILALLPIGLFMGGMENSPFKFQVFALHKSFGLLVFFLGLARLIWRFASPPPDHMENHKHWERVLAAASHFWLYICMLGMPLSGWLMSSAGQFPIPFFGLQMPALIGKDEELGDLFYRMHEILAYTLLFTLALHMAGALKHHVLDKDRTLQRMTWDRPGLLIPAILVIVAGASYAVSGLMIGRSLLADKPADDQAAEASAVSAAPAEAQVDTAKSATPDNLPAHGWAIDASRSKLQFEAVLYNAPFTGDFGNFTGPVIFDPADLSTARADIFVSMKDVKTGDADRDNNIQSMDWFDTNQFPDAHFVAEKFEKGEDDNYVAVGEVTIKGVTMPLIIPFTLEIKEGAAGKREAHMLARFSLDRTHFNIGTEGQWATDTSVDKNVEVAIDLIAVQ